MENKNIYQKMSAITNELRTIAKNLNVDMGKGKSYKAVQEKDILDAVKPIEEKYGVYSYPIARNVIDSDVLEKETQYGISKNLYMRIETTYRFVNIDKSDEYIDMISYGDGIDSGDKAPGKAMTYADKYALMKAYKIATGDDPDAEGSPEKGYSKSKSNTIKETVKQNDNEKLELIVKLSQLVNTKKVDYEKLLQYYGVKTNSEMTIPQLQEAIKTVESREDK